MLWPLQRILQGMVALKMQVAPRRISTGGKLLTLLLAVLLAGQTLFMILYVVLVVFNIMGRDYDAAMITAGFIGFGMGATSNAMANMQAVSRRYGPSPSAYFVIPMVGGLFNDFFNAAIIAFCIGLLA